jgi:hypothetical protein
MALTRSHSHAPTHTAAKISISGGARTRRGCADATSLRLATTMPLGRVRAVWSAPSGWKMAAASRRRRKVRTIARTRTGCQPPTNGGPTRQQLTWTDLAILGPRVFRLGGENCSACCGCRRHGRPTDAHQLASSTPLTALLVLQEFRLGSPPVLAQQLSFRLVSARITGKRATCTHSTAGRSGSLAAGRFSSAAAAALPGGAPFAVG